MHDLGGCLLRRPEPGDADALYRQKNDPQVAALLEGFSRGMSRADVLEWIERHRRATDEVLWVVADADGERCLGHVGLYRVDPRVRSAEFGIMLGEPSVWGRGIGRACTRFALEYGFGELNLNRISLTVLASNVRAAGLYRSLGFRDEGRLRQAQYRRGRYDDVLLMALLRDEFAAPVDASPSAGAAGDG